MSSLIEWYRGYSRRRREANIAKWERQRKKGKFHYVARMSLIFVGIILAVQFALRYLENEPFTLQYIVTLVAGSTVFSILANLYWWNTNEIDFQNRNPPDTGGE